MENDQDRTRTTTRLTKKSTATPGLEMARMPPQAIDLEEAVIGALLLEKEAVNDVIEVLSPESFYKEEHGKIYRAIKELFQNSEPVDILTVTQHLRKQGELDNVGGPYFISQLTNRVASAANVEFHARIIAQKYIQRKLIEVSSSIQKRAYDETTDVFDLMDFAEGELFKVAEGNIRKNYDKMSDILRAAITQIEAMSTKEGISGVSSGFRDLDKVTSGFQPSDMVVIAARPGMGKTAFVLSLARNTAVDFGNAVAVFSLEMSSIQLVNRLIAAETEIDSEKLRKGTLAPHEWTQLNSRITKLAEAPIFIDDTPALSVFELRAKCRRLKQQHDIKMVIIDYLQLMTAGDNKGNREQEISTISRSIKSIAKELNVPILALSQLSRAVETRGGDKRPMLSDLRESGAIEQDADMVMFIYRPEYYGLHEDENGNPTDGIGELIIAKHRHGSLENVKIRFINRLIKYTNLDNDLQSYGAAMPMNTDFDEQSGAPAPTMTFKSKMDEIPDEEEPDF